MFFWDYDTGWGADRSRIEGGPKPWGHLEFENTERLLEIHGRMGVPACFAVVGAAALPGNRPYHDPSQVRSIHAAGHEIASHSFRHEWLPGLRGKALLETLRVSRDALQQCIGAEVLAFVPPFNQPFDYAARWAVSLSERKEAGRARTDLKRLCEALGETGYRFCRIAYRPIHFQIVERVLGQEISRPVDPERIAGIVCVRLNTPGGFDGQVPRLLERHAGRGGIWVIYGHPHSISEPGSRQSMKAFESLLDRIRPLVLAGAARCVLPRDILEAEGND